MPEQTSSVRIAIVDLYNNTPNQGMRCIRQLLHDYTARHPELQVTVSLYDTRYRDEIPTLDHDIYISTGGPGSPYDGHNSKWEKGYFDWLDKIWQHNRTRPVKKSVFAICHSYQMLCRYFEVGAVIRRKSPSFGIFAVHKTGAGKKDPLFRGLHSPFYAADFRAWQVVQPDRRRLQALGAEILALEKIRPHVRLERATMAIRFSPEIVGVQFHPEADNGGMLKHFVQPERRKKIVAAHGEAKYDQIIERLQDEGFLGPTYQLIIPGFLDRATLRLTKQRIGAKARQPA